MRHIKRRSQIKPKKKFFGFLKSKTSASDGKPDYFLMGLIFLLCGFGLVMLSSASSVKAFREFEDSYYFVWQQFSRGFLIGLIFFYFLSKFDYRKWERFTIAFVGVSFLLLILVFIPGIGAQYGSARSWLNIAGFSVQPAEIVKLLLILSLAGWFSYRGKQANADFWNGLIPFMVILGAVSGLIMLQPDLGTLMVVVTIAMTMYYIAGASIRHVVGLLLLGVGAFGLAIIQAPYRAARLATFLNPELDPSGAGYHINQALLAVGSGGLFGLGFGQSRQKFAYLPEVMGDSIFAVIAEELGFILAASLVVIFILFAWRCIRLAKRVDDDYARLIVIGITSWISFQAFFNIGAMIGILPLTGIPLPFISFGGTALVATLAAGGILINISRHVDLN